MFDLSGPIRTIESKKNGWRRYGRAEGSRVCEALLVVTDLTNLLETVLV